MPAYVAFEVVAEDVQSAARDMGHEIDFDSAEILLAKLSDEDIRSVERAALRGGDLSDQAEGAVTRIEEIMEQRGLLARASAPAP